MSIATGRFGGYLSSRLVRTLRVGGAGAVLLAPSIFVLSLTTASGAITPPTSTTVITEGETPYVVPSGTTYLQVTVVGAAGRATNAELVHGGTPGKGAEVKAILPVAPRASTLYVEVGGSDGTNGGGSSVLGFAPNGGGASDIQTCSVASEKCIDTAIPATDPRLVVAGGGGGGGQDFFYVGGTGGNAGAFDTLAGPGAGGAGADLGAGGGGLEGDMGNTPAAAAGGPGSASCGGFGGKGSPGNGGVGGDVDGDVAGGGGGGGWVGGSGGGTGSCGPNTSGSGGGGGGGASYVEKNGLGVSVSEATVAPEVIITPRTGRVPTSFTISGSTGKGSNPATVLAENGLPTDAVGVVLFETSSGIACSLTLTGKAGESTSCTTHFGGNLPFTITGTFIDTDGNYADSDSTNTLEPRK